MDQLPLISVIVPVYNGEKFIHECVDSVLGQTYQNIECILIDGDSPDRCPEICDQYALQDERVKVIHKGNNGLSDDRNAGIRIARGEYVTFVDSDDCISKDMIQILYDICCKYHVLLAQCNYTIKKPEFDIEIRKSVYATVIEKQRCMMELLGKNSLIFCVSWGKLLHRSLFKGISFPYGKLHEDVYTSHLFFEAAGKMAYTTKRLYYYRQRRGSLMDQELRNPKLERVLSLINRAQYFERHEYNEALQKQIYICLSMINEYYCNYPEKWSNNQKKYMVSEYRKMVKKLVTMNWKNITFECLFFSFFPEIYNICRKK